LQELSADFPGGVCALAGFVDWLDQTTFEADRESGNRSFEGPFVHLNPEGATSQGDLALGENLPVRESIAVFANGAIPHIDGRCEKRSDFRLFHTAPPRCHLHANLLAQL
jgi:hypothetical protein